MTTTKERIEKTKNWIIQHQYGADSPIVQLLEIVAEQQKQIEKLSGKLPVDSEQHTMD